MAFLKNLSKESIYKAIQYIDENCVLDKHKSTKYELVDESRRNIPQIYSSYC